MDEYIAHYKEENIHDATGKITEHIYYDSNGYVSQRIKYDNDGNEATIYDYDINTQTIIARDLKKRTITYSSYDFPDEIYKCKYYDENGIDIFEENDDGSATFFDKQGRKVYQKNADGKIVYKTYNGKNVTIDDTVVEYDRDSNILRLQYQNGDEEIFTEGKLIEERQIDGEGIIAVTKYNADGLDFYDINQDGTIIYYLNDESVLSLSPDGHYEFDEHEGTYIIDDEGHIICQDENGNKYEYKNGWLTKQTKSNGNVLVYDREKNSLKRNINGKARYSMLNHIEYDEEEYDRIMKTMIKIYDEYPQTINNKFNNVQEITNQFTDDYSSVEIWNLGAKINDDIKEIELLKENINYSLLAYQTCDEEIKESVDKLIDKLFDDNESLMAQTFKDYINPTIEDANKDKILEYKASTNFRDIYNNAIPVYTYKDKNNNVWYFSGNKKLLDVQGDNLSINYGGEEFSVSFDKKTGVAVLKDSNGKPLNIFGDYNIESGQYGGNQGDFKYHALALLENEAMNDIFNHYFPNATPEEKEAYLEKICNNGCGFIAITNALFKKMEGYELEFYKKFGYPMYNVVCDEYGNGITVNYNYEPVALELYCNIYNTDSISEIYKNDYVYFSTPIIKSTFISGGTSVEKRKQMEEFLKNEYDLDLYNSQYSDESVTYFADMGYNLYTMDGELYLSYGGPHAMIEIEKIDENRRIVSTWGRKMICESIPEYQDYRNWHSTIYTNGS